jgi:hypothetical protein
VHVWTDRVHVSVLVRWLGLVQVVMVLVVGMGSPQVVSLLDVLPFVLNMGMRGVVALKWRGGMVYGLPLVILVLVQLERFGSLIVVTVVVFVEVALIGQLFWIVLTSLWQMARHWFYSFGTNPVLSCLFTHVLTFEFQVGDLRTFG